MTASNRHDPLVMRLFDALQRLPLAVKVLVLVLVTTGGLALLLYHEALGHLARVASHDARETARAQAKGVATRAAGLLATRDSIALRRLLRQEAAADPSIAYIVIQDGTGQILAHSFNGAMPPGLRLTVDREAVVTLRSDQHLLFEGRARVPSVTHAWLRLARSSAPVERLLAVTARRFGWNLAVGMGIAAVIVVLMVLVLHRPLGRLAAATRALGAGDLSHRVPERGGDELARLAAAFNDMAEALEAQRAALAQRDAERTHLLRRVQEAQERERARLARDLHDDLGGTLSALLMELRVLAERQTASRPRAEAPQAAQRQPEGADARPSLAHVEARLSELVQRVRHLAWSLRPQVLDDMGLHAALEHHVAEISRSAEPSIDYLCTCSQGCRPLPVAREAALALFRVAQECLTNALRHARATRISVVLSPGPEQITLIVEDDGVGFTMASLPTGDRPHLGLAGMRERIEALGGTLVIESTPGDGTLVRAAVPAAAPEAASASNPQPKDPPRADAERTPRRSLA